MTHVLAYFRQSDEEGAKKQLSIPPSRSASFRTSPAATSPMSSRPGMRVTRRVPGPARPAVGPCQSGPARPAVGLRPRPSGPSPFFGPYVMNEIRSRGIPDVAPWGEDVASPMGRFMTDIRMRFGAYYREEVADRTRVNTKHRLKEGLWTNHAPTGYSSSFEKARAAGGYSCPIRGPAPAAKRLFRAHGLGRVAEEGLRALGPPTPAKVLWQRDNPMYIGLVYQGRENVRALADRSHFALWLLAEDPHVRVDLSRASRGAYRPGDVGSNAGPARDRPRARKSVATRSACPARSAASAAGCSWSTQQRRAVRLRSSARLAAGIARTSTRSGSCDGARAPGALREV